MSLLRNMAISLIRHERIRTTLAKAKELRPFAERLVTLGKKDSLHARRRALSILPKKDAVAKLFNEVSPRFAERPGGYTRILKLEPRQGDGAPMAFIEFVDFKFAGAESAPEAKESKSKKAKTKADKSEPEEKPAEELEAKGGEDEADADTSAKPRRAAKKKTTKKKAAAKKTASKKKAPKKKTAKKTKKTKKKT